MKPDDDIRRLKLADAPDLTALQIYLIDALEDLESLETLCKALKITTYDVENMLDEAL